MHALLAHAYHLLLLPAHLAARPLWRSLAVCVAAAVGARLWGRRAAPLVAAVPVIAAWAVLAPMQDWPPTPVARLTGLGVLALAGALLAERRGRSWRALCLTAAASAWWLRGAPTGWADLAGCVPVFIGVAGGFAVAERLTSSDNCRGIVAGAAALAAGLWLTGAAPHWAHAALAPACAAIILLRVPGSAPVLARLTLCVAAAALVASDRGRNFAVDAACLTPLVVWAALARHRRASA